MENLEKPEPACMSDAGIDPCGRLCFGRMAERQAMAAFLRSKIVTSMYGLVSDTQQTRNEMLEEMAKDLDAWTVQYQRYQAAASELAVLEARVKGEELSNLDPETKKKLATLRKEVSGSKVADVRPMHQPEIPPMPKGRRVGEA